MPEPAQSPAFAELVSDLLALRREGIARLRHLDLPALRVAVLAVGQAEKDQPVEAPAIEHLLREVLHDLREDKIGSVGSLLFGLEPGTRSYPPAQLREDAAERWGVSLSRFRQRWERHVVEQIAEGILLRAERYRLRLARLEMERRSPASTRLAVQWVERFEAMYRIWTPLHALGANLSAYRATLIEPDHAEGDKLPAWIAEGASREEQAAGYVTAAIYYYTDAQVVLAEFMRRYGGLWLLSDETAEQEIADALYRVHWHSPNNERDDSYLRHTLTEQASGELHPFLSTLAQDSIGMSIHDEWQRWADTECACHWSSDSLPERQPFATHLSHSSIDPKCQLHAVVSAVGDYCLLLDDDWRRIADWYRIDSTPPAGTTGEHLYEEIYSPEPAEPLEGR